MSRSAIMNKQEWQEARTKLLGVLLEHVGAHNPCDMGSLYEQVFGRKWRHKINDSRRLRVMITELREEGRLICSSVSGTHGGYYLAATKSEGEAYLSRNRSRALRSLELEAKMRRIPLVEVLKQMVLSRTRTAQPSPEVSDEAL